MLGHGGLINTSFYFGVCQGSESSVGTRESISLCARSSAGCKYGVASTNPRFWALAHNAMMLAALKVIKKAEKHTGYFF